MAESTISVQMISPDLLSGSADTLRTAVGGFWYQVSASDGLSMVQEEFDELSPSAGYFDKVQSNSAEGYVETVNSDVLMLNKRFPIRIYGNDDAAKNDASWKELLSGIYTEREFMYCNASYTIPYDTAAAPPLEYSGMAIESVAITYDYNRYVPSYQIYAATIASELQLPNYYLLGHLATYDIYEEDADLFDGDLINFVTREGSYEDVNSLFTINNSAMRADLDVKSAKQLALLTDSNTAYNYSFLNTTYLTASLPQTSLSGATISWANSRLQNILFDNDAIDKLYKTDDISSNSEYFPYYTKISFPLDDTSDFWESIKENNFSSKFIKTLYMAFDNNIEELRPQREAHKVGFDRYVSNSDLTASYIETTSDANYRTLDYPTFLAYCRNTYSSTASNCMFMGENNVHRSSVAKGRAGAYRYLNSVSADGVISDMITYLSSSANFDISSLADVYGQNESKSETLAYRIRKSGISSDPSAGTTSRSVIQNYWIMNSDMQDFEFYDTQIKYDTDYTYSVTAYKLVQGFRYKFSDLTLTKQLACDLDGKYGLEFYNPITDARTDPIYDTSGGKMQSLNDFATIAQTTSKYPYLADMYLNYEPYLKIVEVGIAGKSQRVTDNWPAKPHIRPYQIIDNSQTIGFEVSFGVHIDTPYLATITTEEQTQASTYLASRNLLTVDNVPYETISEQRYIEIYRLTEKPTAVTDFENSLIHTMDLITPNSKYSYKTEFFENIIKTNQKYYYLFRALNEQRVPGHVSDICEAELVNDGGYLYSVFNTIKIPELVEQTKRRTSKAFKKLLQFTPQINQVTLVQDELDYSQTAGSQVDKLTIGSSEDLIWDKTFKIRLTSKKTNKKIDLNITYKLQSEY